MKYSEMIGRAEPGLDAGPVRNEYPANDETCPPQTSVEEITAAAWSVAWIDLGGEG